MKFPENWLREHVSTPASHERLSECLTAIGLEVEEDTVIGGALTGVIGTLMAMEAIKLITGLGEPLIGRLLLYDGRAARFTEIGY